MATGYRFGDSSIPLAGSGFKACAPEIARSGLGTIGFSALMGGAGAELTGGDFWEGAGTGAIVASLNHLQNTIQERIARTAEKYIDSEAWSYEASKSNFAEGTNKCNLFAYDVTTEAGAGLACQIK